MPKCWPNSTTDQDWLSTETNPSPFLAQNSHSTAASTVTLSRGVSAHGLSLPNDPQASLSHSLPSPLVWRLAVRRAFADQGVCACKRKGVCLVFFSSHLSSFFSLIIKFCPKRARLATLKYTHAWDSLNMWAQACPKLKVTILRWWLMHSSAISGLWTYLG